METSMFMAQSLNAKIARSNGDEDFLSPRNWKEFKKIAEDIGIFVIGRKTYQSVKEWDEKGFKDIKSERLVLSKKNDFEPEDEYIKVKSPKEAIEKSNKIGFERLLVTGGASVNTSFLRRDMIDKVIINIEPYILGNGISLFQSKDLEKNIELESYKELTGGIIQLKYKIKNQSHV